MTGALSVQTVSRLLKEKRQLPLVASLLIAILLFIVQYVYRTYFSNASSPKKRSSGKRSSGSDGAKKSSRTSSTGSSGGKSKHKSSSSKKKADPSLPSIILLLGIPGSGKSTWAKQYLEKVHKSYMVISSDVIRSTLTGTITDFSKEEAVEEEMVKQIIQNLKLNRGCIVDDWVHNLSPKFRTTLLEQVKANQLKVNTLVHLFPIKPIFAFTRLEKDIADGKKRHVPTKVEMENLQVLYNETEGSFKTEGWIENS